MIIPIKPVAATEIATIPHTHEITEQPGNTKQLSYTEELKNNIEFIGKSLTIEQPTPELDNYYKQIHNHLNVFLTQNNKLPEEIITAIFHVYSINQNYFNDLVIDLLAENNHLSAKVLNELINVKESPFVILRLVQNRLNLPANSILANFIKLLSSENEASRIMTINLYHQIRKTIPAEIKSELISALITLLPEVSNFQRFKIIEILTELKPSVHEQSRIAIQQQVIDWSATTDLEKKKSISVTLYDKINGETKQDLTSFFKKNLALQNKEFLNITKAAFTRLSTYQELFWNEEERALLPLFEVITNGFLPLFIRRWQKGIYSYEVGNNGELLLNQNQHNKLQKQLQKIGWDVTTYFKQITFIDIKEVNKFIDLIEKTGLASNDLTKVLNKYDKQHSSITTMQLYTELLQNLLTEIKLPSENDKKILINCIKYLLEHPDWQADFIFYFIKNGVRSNSIPVVIRVLTLLRDYKIKTNPEAIDREGKTTIAILKEEPSSKLVASIKRLIKDNSFFVDWDISSLIEELRKLNPSNSAIEPLITGFISVFNKINLIKQDWMQSRYQLVMNDPKSEIQDGYIYLYEKLNRLCLATKENTVCATDDKYQELETLRDYLDKPKPNIVPIYDQAVKLNLVPKLRGITKPLTAWQVQEVICKNKPCDSKNDFLRWRQAIGKINPNNTDDLAEAMAVLSQLIANINHYYPRPSQLLGLFIQTTAPRGRITQIATGEGKSIIIFMLAALDVISGVQAVDILTSSYELAIRDNFEAKPLYEQLGISVDNNAQNPNDCYKSIVVYGDAASFIAAILRGTGSGSRKERRFSRIIVDEEDSMFCDSNNMLVLLASQIPEFEVFTQLFTYMYGTVREVAATIEDYQFIDDPTMNGCYLKKYLFDKTQKENPLKPLIQETFGDDKDPEAENKLKNLKLATTCDKFIEDYMHSYVMQMLNRPPQDRAINIPRHLKEFAESQIDNFVSSLLSSFAYEENVDYIIKYPGNPQEGKDSYSTLEIVDADKTGTIMYGLLWENGLHQFLQMRLGLTVIPENVVSVFMSYVSFFLLYDKTAGLSGSIGSLLHQNFIQNTYGLESMIIPRFIYKDLVEFPTFFARSEEEARQWIIDSAYENSRYRSRATLIIVSTIKEVAELKTIFLKQQIEEKSEYPNLRIITYSMGGKEEADAIKEKLKVGDVIIATNLGTRGTDLRLSLEVRNNGGLHIIDTSYPDSSRVGDQRIGRAGRQDDPGSYQAIYNLKKLTTKCMGKELCLNQECDNDEWQKLEKCMAEERYENEKLLLLRDELIEVPYLRARDNIRYQFEEFLREANSPTGYKLVINRRGKWDKLEDLTLNLYHDDKKLKLKIVKKTAVIDVDITELVNIINPEAPQKILDVLSNVSSKTTALTTLEHEIIQFIAASLGFSQTPSVYDFAEYKLHELFTAHSETKENYLYLLLKNDDRYANLQNGANIDGALLDKVELRETFFLWEENLALFSNGAMNKQTVEDFGLWLKQVSPPFRYSLHGLSSNDGREQAQAKVQQYIQKVNDDFLVFIQRIVAKYKSGNLITNPSYAVNEAWKLVWIFRDHGDISQKKVTNTLRTSGFFTRYINNTKQLTAIEDQTSDRIFFATEDYHLETLLSKAINYADKAITLDPEFIGIWAAYNARAVLEIIQKSSVLDRQEQKEEADKVITTYIEYMQKAIGALQMFTMAPLEAELSYLFQHDLAPTTDLAKQLVFTIECYKRILVTFEENIQVALEAINNPLGKLDVERPVSIEVATQGIDINGALNLYLSTKGITGKEAWLIDNTVPRSGSISTTSTISHRQMVVNQIEQYGGYLFKMRVVNLKEKEERWWHKLVVAVTGLISIAAGIALMAVPGAGVFLTSFSVSLMVQGVQDLISSAISFFTGSPINLRDWISAKGFSLAVSLAISGALQLLQKISEIYKIKMLDISKKMNDLNSFSQKNAGEWMFNTFKFSAATRIITGVVSKLGNKLLVDEKDIESEANSAINQVIQSCKSLLERLKATAMLRPLYGEVENMIIGYKWRFSVAAQAGLDTGTGVLDAYNIGGIRVGQYVNTITHMVSNSIESSGIISEISDKVKEMILSKEKSTLKTGEIFRRILVSSYRNIGDLLAYEINAERIDINDQYDCAKLADIKLSESLSKYKNRGEIDLVSKCSEVKDLLLSRDSFQTLRNVFVNGVTRLKSDIEKDNVHVGADVVATELAAPTIALTDKAIDGIIDYIKEHQTHLPKETSSTLDQKIPLDPKLLKSGIKLKEQEKQLDPKFDPKAKTQTTPKSFESKCDELGICSFAGSKPDGFNSFIDDLKKGNGGLSLTSGICPRYVYFDNPRMIDQLWTSNSWDITDNFADTCLAPKHDLDNWWWEEPHNKQKQLECKQPDDFGELTQYKIQYNSLKDLVQAMGPNSIVVGMRPLNIPFLWHNFIYSNQWLYERNLAYAHSNFFWTDSDSKLYNAGFFDNKIDNDPILK